MKVIVPIIVCATLGLAACAGNAPGPTATAAPVNVTPYLGHYYAGAITGVRYPSGNHAQEILSVVKNADRSLAVLHCFKAQGDFNAIAPAKDMTCLTTPATLAGDTLVFTGSDGDRVTLTLNNGGKSIFFHDQYPRDVLRGTLAEEGPVPAG